MSSQELVPAGSHTLVINEPDTQRAIMLMDSHDLEQAMAELRGEVLATFVYRPKGAKPQLTYAGIKEAARLYRNVHFGATAVPLPDGMWMITSYAHNLADNTRVDYPMPYPAFDPANQEQAIKFRANLSKSLRNALAAVLPVAYLQTMIERWLERGKEAPSGEGQGSPPHAAAQAPPGAQRAASDGQQPQATKAAGDRTPMGAERGAVIRSPAGGLSVSSGAAPAAPLSAKDLPRGPDGKTLGERARALLAEIGAAASYEDLNGTQGLASRVRAAQRAGDLAAAESAALFDAINRRNQALRAVPHAS